MKVTNILRSLTLAALMSAGALTAFAQSSQSQSSGIRRGGREKAAETQQGPGVTQRMQSFYESADGSDADLQWMRVIYRSLDLENPANQALYFPEEPAEGEESLIRIILRLVADGRIPAYEYLDGREDFTDKSRLNVAEMLDRFHIPYTQAKGSTEKNPRYTIEPDDFPAYEVLSYYIVERWEFDTRSNRMDVKVEAVCPVIHRSGDFGMESVKYPMFWVKLEPLRPYLAQQDIFVDDDNNLTRFTYDDFFAMNMYDGEIYKTRNLANKSLMQLYPDPDDRKRAQDSIQARLDSYDKHLWVPTREELQAAAAKRDSIEGNEPAEKVKRESPRRSTRSGKSRAPKVKENDGPKNISVSGSAVRSVRRHR
ncbi:MAG: gliding motility protein GldN [Muribaculaceae bacterium]|nr:gliding motility protein GldN [Muribaculaceae bacterium]